MMTAPRVAHAGYIAGMMLVAVGAAFATAKLMNGDAAAVALAPVVVGVSSLPAILPVFLSGRVAVSKWGMLAFVGTVVQPMGIMALGLFFEKTRTLSAMPYWVACLAGGLFMLAAQVSAALYVLSRANAGANASGSSTPSIRASEAV